VFVTSFYSFRLYFLVFHGQERYDQNPDAHHDDHHGDHGHHGDGKPHESPWVVTVPLLLLAVPSVVIGYLTIQPMLFGDFLADAIFINTEAHPAMAKFAEIFHGPLAMVSHAFFTPPLYLAAGGALTAWYMYMVNPALPAAIARTFRPVVTVMENKYYMDWFNENVLARGARALGVGLWKGGDRGLIEGGIVNASWKLVGAIAAAVRRVQSGYLYHYALVMIVGVLLFMTYFVWLAK
jgi:NADH-quinone oxidoreductase subunit L